MSRAPQRGAFMRSPLHVLLPLAVLGSATLVTACGPEDGVLSFAFALEPVEAMVLPDTNDLGVELTVGSFSQASGRCMGAPPSGFLEVHIEGLPHLEVPKSVMRYRLTLMLGERSIAPQAWLWRALEAVSLVRTAHAHGKGASTDAASILVRLVEFNTDELGRVDVHTNLHHGLDKVVGARVELVVPVDATTENTYLILDGRVGNLADDAGAATPPPSSGGHVH